MKRFLAAAALLLAVALAGCSGSEAKLADSVTRAVYNNDMSGVTANFSSDLAPKVTRASLGTLSDMMHKMGNYQGLTLVSTDLPRHLSTFDAKFDRGDLTVRMRLDGDGKIIGYYVTEGSPS